MTLQFYVAHAYVPWWMTCLSTRLIFIALAHWQPPTPLVWSLGALVSCLILIPYLGWVGVNSPAAEAGPSSDLSFLQFLFHFFRVVFIWLLINYLFERFIGLPRYRYHSADPGGIKKQVLPEKSPQSRELPAFLEKSQRIKTIEDLYSVSAEEHYIRIHSPSGDELLYKKFSDAVKELEALAGIRIHRSHWVSPYAVSGIIRDGKRMSVKLKDGQQLPVSRPYQAMVRQLEEKCHKPH